MSASAALPTWPKYPSIYEINTCVWLAELRARTGSEVHLGTVPAHEWDRIAALGVDTASIDYGQSRDFLVHRVANEANVPGFENVAHLDQLPQRGAWIIALPMKIGGGSGGPLRIVAVIP